MVAKWTTSFVNLVKLTTYSVEIEQQDLEMVGSISTLLALQLHNSSSTRSIISSVGFQRLHTLRLRLTVRWLIFEAGAMPNLKKLVVIIQLDKLKYSDGGTGFDDFGLHHLSNLELVSVMILNYTRLNKADLKRMGAYTTQESAMVDFKSMVDAHPNRPKLDFGGGYHTLLS